MTVPTIAVVGIGNWGMKVLKILNGLDCQVIALARSDKSRQSALTLLPEDRIVSSYKQLNDIDGAIITTPTSTHKNAIKELAPLNIPLFVEKPLTGNLDEAREILSNGHEKLFVMDKYRYHPAIKSMAQIAQSGEFGAVQSLRTRRTGWALPNDVDCIWDLAPHELAICLHILGDLPPLTFSSIDRLDNQPVSVTATLGEHRQFHFEILKGHYERHRQVRLLLSSKLITWKEPDLFLEVIDLKDLQQSKPSKVQTIPIPAEDALTNELSSFLGFLKGGSAPVSSIHDAINVIETITAIVK